MAGVENAHPDRVRVRDSFPRDSAWQWVGRGDGGKGPQQRPLVEWGVQEHFRRAEVGGGYCYAYLGMIEENVLLSGFIV